MSRNIDHHFRVFGSSKDITQAADTVKTFLDLCPNSECHFWDIEHKKKSGNHHADVWLGTAWHDCANLLQTIVTGLSAEFPNIAVDYLQYTDDCDIWSHLYSIRKGVVTLRGQWSCLLSNEAAVALADLKSSKGGKAAALAAVTAAVTEVVKEPDSYGTITADTFADSIVAAVRRNPSLPDDPAVVKNFVRLEKALAAHGWPSNWFDECDDFDDDDGQRGPKMPRKFKALLERVCLPAVIHPVKTKPRRMK